MNASTISNNVQITDELADLDNPAIDYGAAEPRLDAVTQSKVENRSATAPHMARAVSLGYRVCRSGLALRARIGHRGGRSAHRLRYLFAHPRVLFLALGPLRNPGD